MAVIARHRLHHDGALITAPCFKIIAARAKVAARRAFMRQGKVTGNGNQGACIFVCTGQRDRPEQRLGIGMLHVVKHLLDGAAFDRLTGIHHANAVAGLQHKPKIVRDKQHRGAVFFAQILDQLHHSRLDSHIKCRGRLIQN